MRVLYPPLIILSLGLASCASQSPDGIGWVPPSQRTVQSAEQWNGIAADIAQSLQTALVSPESTQWPVLYVESPASSIFNSTFHQLLKTQLMEKGFSISTDPRSGMPVRYNVQLITHNEFVSPNLVVDPSREIIINVSVKSGDRFVTRVSNIYTVSHYDHSLFLTQVAVPRRMEVVGP